MIARRIPNENDPTAGSYAVVAQAYGLTEAELRQAALDWQNCEGFDGDGNEYETLHDWITQEHNTRRDNTPWQKGDNTPA